MARRPKRSRVTHRDDRHETSSQTAEENKNVPSSASTIHRGDRHITKVRLAEDGWNSRNPALVALAYTPDCAWRNRAEFPAGRDEIVAFLTRKWNPHSRVWHAPI